MALGVNSQPSPTALSISSRKRKHRMSTVAALAERLSAGITTLSAWCGIPEPAIAGILAREGFDAVALDMQHGAVDFASVVRAVPLVAGAGKPTIARIPVGDFATASRLLDAGVSAVIAPMINTVEDARRFGAFMKYPPVGERSWGPHGALPFTGLAPAEYFARGNDITLSFAMVETREALGIVDEILAAPGIDGIFIGPADLSIALSGGRTLDPFSEEVNGALDHAFARTKAAGKLIGVYAPTGERAAEHARQGIPLVAIAGDTALLRAGAQAALRAARG
jgi:4-hydroxy-2-oxoheptanedioate aldolase